MAKEQEAVHVEDALKSAYVASIGELARVDAELEEAGSVKGGDRADAEAFAALKDRRARLVDVQNALARI